MSQELFTEIPKSTPPPTLAEQIASEIQKRHGPILTHKSKAKSQDQWIALRPEYEIDDVYQTDDIGDIMARSCRLYDEAGLIGYGSTEAESIIDLGRRRKWLTHSRGFFK